MYVTQLSSEPRATGLWLKRRRPVERALVPQVSAWVLVVTYRAGSDEHAARLSLSDDLVAKRVEALLLSAQLGNRRAACVLYACLHDQWGRERLVQRDPAWDAVLSYVASLAAHPVTGISSSREWVNEAGSA
jgi:hypothetical protein